jgi:hypothetical protein
VFDFQHPQTSLRVSPSLFGNLRSEQQEKKKVLKGKSQFFELEEEKTIWF